MNERKGREMQAPGLKWFNTTQPTDTHEEAPVGSHYLKYL